MQELLERDKDKDKTPKLELAKEIQKIIKRVIQQTYVIEIERVFHLTRKAFIDISFL